MYGEIKDKLSSDGDVASYIVNETRDLSLDDDIIYDSDHSIKSWSVLPFTTLLYITFCPAYSKLEPLGITGSQKQKSILERIFKTSS